MYKNEAKHFEGHFYWTVPRAALAIMATVLALFIIGFLATGADLASYRFWAPKYENARRQVFENTQSYIQGKTDYLTQLRYQYQKADGEQKESLRMLILSESSTVDNEQLPPDLQGFIVSLRGAR